MFSEEGASQEQNLDIAAGFIDTKAPEFHAAFGVPADLNKSTMQYEPPEIRDLRETLERHQQMAGKYVDFIRNLNDCTWDDVHVELRKAQAAAAREEQRRNSSGAKAWRNMAAATSSILEPGIVALPEGLWVLNAGLAVVFSLARHSEMNRRKILTAFERVPNIIEMAKMKAERFPLDGKNPKSIQLHRNVHELHATLLRALPALINKLVPGTFLNAWKSPRNTWKIDKILDEVSTSAESVHVCAEGLVEEVIVDTYSVTMSIQQQVNEVLQAQKEMFMAMTGTRGKTHLLHFLLEHLNNNVQDIFSGRDQADLSETSTVLSGYTPEDLLRMIDVNHLRINLDATNIMRRGTELPQEAIEQAAYMISAPQVKELLGSAGSGVVAIEGHLDPTQFGKISPLSVVCATLSQALRRQGQESAAALASDVPTSPQPEKGPPRSGSIVLEYFCAIHTADDDDLRGPQGLMRCLATQLILSLVANGWIRQSDAVNLPYLCDGEEERLEQRSLGAFCRLFTELVRLAPEYVPIYCLVDGWSAYERDELWRADYDMVLNAFREVANPEGGANFRLFLTSPTSCHWLGDFLMPGEKVSLRHREASGRNWRGAGRGGLMGLARATTMPMPSTHGGLGGSFPPPADDYGRPWMGDRRTSAN